MVRNSQDKKLDLNSIEDRINDSSMGDDPQNYSTFERLEKVIHVRLELEFENYDESKNQVLAV